MTNKQMQMKNFHVITVTFSHGIIGAHITMHSPRFEDRIRLSYDYSIGATNVQAIDWLQRNGFDVTGQAEGKHGTKDAWLIITTTFKPLKTTK